MSDIHEVIDGDDIEHYCRFCAEEIIPNVRLPSAVHVIPFLSSITWKKLRERKDTINRKIQGYANAIPMLERWNRNHYGFYCELCTSLISGTRYECLDCAGCVSFCQTCAFDHDSNHWLMLIYLPLKISTGIMSEKELKVNGNCYQYCGHEVLVEGEDTVAVKKMSPMEIFIACQALINGEGVLKGCLSWQSVVSGLSVLYEALTEQHKTNGDVKRTLTKYFKHIAFDLCEVESEEEEASSGLPGSCFYFRVKGRTVFIVRTKTTPTQFFRIDLTDERGKTLKNRSSAMFVKKNNEFLLAA
jgi:hypothetical protein